MSPANVSTLAAIGLVVVCLMAILSLVFGAMASINNNDPADRGMTDLGHRCVVWVSVVLMFGVIMMLAVESVAQ